MHTYKNDTGFIRLEGEDIVDGIVDISSATRMLSGTQEALGYFLKKENSDFAQYGSINFPVQTRKGSWEIVVPFIGTITPETAVPTIIAGAVGTLIVQPVAAGLVEYAKTIGSSTAARRMEQKSNQDSFRHAFELIGSVIKIAIHLGIVSNKHDLNIKLHSDNKTASLINNRNESIEVTLDEIRAFQECPDKLLRKLGTVVTDYRTLHFGYKVGGVIHEVLIDRDSKEIFTPDEDAEAPVLPELLDGQHIRLIGAVTRGNQQTNTIGFKYNGHVITSEPNKKLITSYIDAHYKTCEIIGTIVRTSKVEVLNGKRDRPKIIFEDLRPVKSESNQISLLI